MPSSKDIRSGVGCNQGTIDMQSHRRADYVLKVGGSLFDLPDLSDRLQALISSIDARCWIVAGGGGFANEVRRLDTIHHWPPELSHRLGMAAMSLGAEMIASMSSRYRLVTTLQAEPDADDGTVHVVDAFRVPGWEQLPASWEMTSDSIAVWVARQLNAKGLLLAKSVDLPTGVPDLPALAALGLIDGYFPHFAGGIPEIQWVNLRRDAPFKVAVVQNVSARPR